MAKKGGVLIAAAAAAIVLANSEDGSGGGAVTSAPAVGANAAAFAASEQAMLRGEVTVAWSGLGMNQSPREARRRDTDCAAHSYGAVREYFRRVPCRYLDRLLFTVEDKGGNTIAVSVAWVRFATPAQAEELKRIDDRWGTGQLSPLPGATVGVPDIRLSGQHYASRRAGDLTVVAEAEEAHGTRLDDSFLDSVARVAVLLPYGG